jgi:L-threonylcarbamoyladenylate synthase
VVAFPTETVYGLGANALDSRAVKRIFWAKGRPQDNPLIVHVATLSMLRSLISNLPPQALLLIQRFWPGPLTLVLPKSEVVPPEVTAGLDTVAVRMPAHPVALALIKAARLPVAAPSANLSGRPSPTTGHHVLRDLRGKIDAVVDGGPAVVGVESTVLDLTSPVPTILVKAQNGPRPRG